MRKSWCAFAAALLPLSVFAQSLVFDTYSPDPCSPNGQATGQCPRGELFRVRLTPVAVGLSGPRNIVFLPGGDLLISEFQGVRIIIDGVLQPDHLAGWPLEPLSVQALYAVAVHPRFVDNRLIYLWYAKTRLGERSESTMALARAELNGGALREVREIFVADAWSDQGGPLNGAAAFGPDGMLYVTMNDHDPLNDTSDDRIRMLAQDLTHDAGKVLRLRDDGSIPADNPFVGRRNANPQIFTYGHRNITGLAWHPDTGDLWSTEIGPMGGDELNVLRPGGNYGWPLVSLGIIYNEAMVSDQPWYRPGMEMPKMWWAPSISPSGLIFYTGDRFPQWSGSIFLGALNGQMVQRVTFNHPLPQAQRRESLFLSMQSRFRHVAEGPDGLIYALTEQRGVDRSGAVYRIEPEQ